MNKDVSTGNTLNLMAINAVSLSTVIAMLDSTIANVALPVIAREFSISESNSILIVNAYQFAVVASLLPLAALGKSVGITRVFNTGVLLFALSSLGCALSESLEMLTVFRVVQGFSAAAILSVNAALIKAIYPASLLGRGLGVNVMLVSVAAAAGPSIASAILAVASWNWLFTINVPVAAVSLLISVVFLNKSPAEKRTFDRTGAIIVFMLGLLFSCTVFGLTRQKMFFAMGSLTVFVLLLETFYLNQKHKVEKALIPVAVFHSKTLSLSLLMSALSYATQLLAYVSLPFYLHDVLHRDIVSTGLLLTAWPLATMFTSVLAGNLLKKYHCNIIGAAGLGLLFAGMLLTAALPAEPGNIDIIWRVALCGAGFGLFQSPNNYLIMTSVNDENTSVASGLLGSSRLLGQIVGSALVALFFNINVNDPINCSLITGACFSFFSLAVSYWRYISAKGH
ncbi:MFS transporter [Pantoea sp. S18]|uniref:MFS transporter n=1 Tax=Pantoea sp. S18 TaxID=3019892 RepID=UPI002B1F4E56|nr:MFS transporter [Pantoea sp. S18]MEA5101372.1 MFS transporter [Pantoea sp. S18]